MRASLDSRQQRLRLGDLRHFRRRRKAFERGRQDGVRFDGAAGRLIELGERQAPLADRRLRAPCSFAMAIAVRNASSAGAGSAGSRLSRISPRRRCRKASEQRCSTCVRERQSFVDAGQRASAPSVSASSSASNPCRTPGRPSRPDRQRPPAPAELGCACHWVIEADPAPNQNAAPPSLSHGGHALFSCQGLQSFCRAQRGGGVPSQNFQIRSPEERMDDRRDMAELGRAPDCRVDQFACAFDLAQLPHRRGEERQAISAVRRRSAPEPPDRDPGRAREGPLAMGPRLDKISTLSKRSSRDSYWRRRLP